MAESKQYIAQTFDNGSVQISEDVIAAVITHAVSEVDGVIGINTKPGADIAEFIGKKNWGRGLKIMIAPDNTVTIDCCINVRYEKNVIDIANATQAAIIDAVNSLAAIQIAAVNVNVCGIVRQ